MFLSVIWLLFLIYFTSVTNAEINGIQESRDSIMEMKRLDFDTKIEANSLLSNVVNKHFAEGDKQKKYLFWVAYTLIIFIVLSFVFENISSKQSGKEQDEEANKSPY